MNEVLLFLSLAAGILALIASVLERRAPGRFPLADLIRERFGRPRRSAILAGLAAGALVVVVPFQVYSAKGWVVPTPNHLPAAFVPLALATLAIKFAWAAAEELIYRGAVLPQVARRSHAATGLVVSALFFAFAHFERTGSRTPNGLSTAVYVLDGIGFGIAWLATGSLWMPTAWHFARNVSIWLVYGQATAVLAPGPVNVTLTGPPLWTGTENQAGVVDLIVTSAVVMIVAAGCARRLRENRGTPVHAAPDRQS